MLGPCTVYQIAPDNSVLEVSASAAVTKYVSDTIRITLEDGSTIEGTSEHRVMLADGTYKCLGEIQETDDIKNL